MRKVVLACSVLVLAGVALAAPPAQAQSVTFTLSAGSLSIAEPATTSLATGTVASLAGTVLTGSLGTTTVTDSRGGVTGWAASIAQTTAFADTGTTIPAANTKAWVTGAIVPTGVATVTAGTYATQATGLALSSTAQSFVTATAVVGTNAASFNPSVAVTLPSNATAGAYSGVITQTVS